jgi:hypothetical protein
MFAMLVLISQICHIVGALIYKAYFRQTDTRTMVLIAFIINVFSTFLTYCFAKRWNLQWGISDLVFLLFTDIIFSTIGFLFFTLPIMALFAKVTPPKIEGTTYAFLTGTMNFCRAVISPAIGTWINHEFVHVNKRNVA